MENLASLLIQGEHVFYYLKIHIIRLLKLNRFFFK